METRGIAPGAFVVVKKGVYAGETGTVISIPDENTTALVEMHNAAFSNHLLFYKRYLKYISAEEDPELFI